MLSEIEAESVTTVVSGSTTEEALLCVNLANRVFEDVITNWKWKHTKTYKPLVAGSNLNELKADSSDLYIDGYNVYYGTINEEQKVHYVDPDTFVKRTISRTSTDSNVTVINNFKIFNDRDPSYYTTFDDETLIFDAMPSGSGLVNTDSKAIVWVEPTTRLSADASVYDLPKQVYPAFRDLCVANAIVSLQGEETKGERRILRASKKLARLAKSADLIDVDDNAYKVITVRRGNSRQTRRIIVS